MASFDFAAFLLYLDSECWNEEFTRTLMLSIERRGLYGAFVSRDFDFPCEDQAFLISIAVKHAEDIFQHSKLQCELFEYDLDAFENISEETYSKLHGVEIHDISGFFKNPDASKRYVALAVAIYAVKSVVDSFEEFRFEVLQN